MNSAEEKKLLRGAFLELRKYLKTDAHDTAVAENFLSRFSGAESYFVYCSFSTETDTWQLIQKLLSAGKKVYLPKIFGKDMLSLPYSNELIENAYGMKEPMSGEDMLAEVAIVPLLAADGEGYRLGYGGGFYDRYFKLHPNILRVGICYEGQVTSVLPRQEGDVPLHALVTEERVRIFEGSGAAHGLL